MLSTAPNEATLNSMDTLKLSACSVIVRGSVRALYLFANLKVNQIKRNKYLKSSTSTSSSPPVQNTIATLVCGC